VRAGFNSTESAEDTQASDSKSPPVHAEIDHARVQAFAERVAALRTGSGEIQVEDVTIIDESGTDTDSLGLDEQVRIRVLYRVKSEPPAGAVLNVGITDNAGRQILHFNPMFSGIYASDAPPGVPQMLEVTFRSPLCPGEYGVTAGIATLFDNPKNHGQTLVDSVIDYCPDAARFSVRFPDTPTKRDLWGIVHVDYEVSARSID
jgi:lipopolysaccharide transport system ATP-binding protein